LRTTRVEIDIDLRHHGARKTASKSGIWSLIPSDEGKSPYERGGMLQVSRLLKHVSIGKIGKNKRVLMEKNRVKETPEFKHAKKKQHSQAR